VWPQPGPGLNPCSEFARPRVLACRKLFASQPATFAQLCRQSFCLVNASTRWAKCFAGAYALTKSSRGRRHVDECLRQMQRHFRGNHQVHHETNALPRVASWFDRPASGIQADRSHPDPTPLHPRVCFPLPEKKSQPHQNAVQGTQMRSIRSAVRVKARENLLGVDWGKRSRETLDMSLSG
jgi:hypothetical protein